MPVAADTWHCAGGDHHWALHQQPPLQPLVYHGQRLLAPLPLRFSGRAPLGSLTGTEAVCLLPGPAAEADSTTGMNGEGRMRVASRSDPDGRAETGGWESPAKCGHMHQQLVTVMMSHKGGRPATLTS